MIQLTRFNGDQFTLNALMIEQIQSFPDTTITLTNGKKIVVQNTEAEVVERTNNFFKHIGLSGSLSEAGEKHD